MRSISAPLALVSWVAPSVAVAAPVWVGDFETNDLSQWSGTLNEEIDGVPYITVVSDVVAQGSYAGRVELHDDAVWPNGLRRVELHHTPDAGRTDEGATTYFAWSFYLPEALPADPDQSIGYWESDASYHNLFNWSIAGEQVTFVTRYPEYTMQWQADGVATAGVWHRIACRVLWSQDPEVGELDVWFDGEQVVTGAAVATLADGNSAFTQVGLLRGDLDFDDVPVIYIDDAVEGDSLEDVHPDPMPSGGDSSSSGSDTSVDDTGTTTLEGGDTTEGGGTTGNVDPSATAADDAPTTDPTTATASAGTGESTGAAQDDDDSTSGCGCGVATPDPAGFGLVGLILGLRRRRRA